MARTHADYHESGIGLGGATPLITASRGPTMGGWDISRLAGVNGFWDELCRDITGDTVSPYDAAFQTLLGVNYIQWYINGYAYPFNVVSASTSLSSLGTIAYGTTPSGLTQAPLHPDQYCENWPLGYAGVSIANGGAGGVAVATGSGFQATYNGGSVLTWPLVVGGTYGVNGAAPSLAVAVVNSNTQATFTTPYSGAPVSGATLTGPFNLACQPGVQGDHHQIVLEIVAATGLPGHLYEAYNLSSTDGGSTWGGSSVGRWDLATGAQPPNFIGASSAAGLPYYPLTPTYDEVSRGAIRHAMAIALGGGAGSGSPWGLGSGGFVFPAMSANGGAGAAGAQAWQLGGVPLGGRLRLKATFDIDAFMAAHPAATTVSRIFLVAAKRYGFVNMDWTWPSQAVAVPAFWDARWNPADSAALGTIATTNLELIDTVNPRFAFSGPSTIAHGVQGTWYLTQDSLAATKDSNYSAIAGVSWSSDGGASWSGTGISVTPNFVPYGPSWGVISNVLPGPLTITFTPAVAGSYLLSVYYNGEYWLLPPNYPITVT